MTKTIEVIEKTIWSTKYVKAEERELDIYPNFFFWAGDSETRQMQCNFCKTCGNYKEYLENVIPEKILCR
jgi:hypothetical protein